MQTIKIKRTVKDEALKLTAFGDSHKGQRYHDISTYDTVLKWLQENKDQEVLLMGDMIECCIRRYKEDQILTIDEQIDKICDDFFPIAEEGRVWGIFQGNHEARGVIEAGFDPTYRMARELNIRNLGGGGKVFCVNVKTAGSKKGRNYSIYAKHGSSGTSRPSGRINSLLRMCEVVNNADLYLHAHVHVRMQHNESPFSIDRDWATMQRQLFVTTGHYLLYEGSYGDRKGYAPTGAAGSPRFRLHADEKKITVRL